MHLKNILFSLLVLLQLQLVAQINNQNLLNTALTYKETNSDTALIICRQILSNLHNNYSLEIEAETEWLIAEIFSQKEQNDSALFHYQNIVNLLESDHKKPLENQLAKTLSAAYNTIAEIHVNIGNFEKAEYYSTKAQEINNKHNLTERFVNSYLTQGKIAYLNSNTSRAKAHWQKGLVYSDSIKNTDLKARLLNNMGSIYYHEQNWDKCLFYFKEAYNLHKQINNEYHLIKAANNVGLIFFNRKQYSKGLQYFLEADSLGQKHKATTSQGMTLHYLINTYMYLNMPDEMQDAFSRFQDILLEQYQQEKAKQINELEVKYEVEKKNKEIELLEKEKTIEKLNNQRKTRLILIIFIAAISLVIIIWFRFQNYKKQQTINRQKLLFQKLETEQKMLRSQMNPHFIFNSLNSIQSFISSEQAYEAEKYLASFAKLMRDILDNSRNNTISLDKEIEMLKLYMQLEQLGVENRFNFEINLHEDIESDFINIPPMLIQPFVENSILHGIASKPNGLIQLNFTEKDDYLICEIDDNGIGRIASEKNKDQKKHNSLATLITQERLDAIGEQFNKKAFFDIHDKIDEKTKEALGTKVIIHLPIISS